MIKYQRQFLACAAIVGGVAVMAMVAGDALAQTKIRVGRTTSGSGFHVPLYVAMEKGFFKREGLDARYVALSGRALVTAGMTGDIDFVPIPGGGSQASLKGAPLRYVVGQSLISQWAIVSLKGIKTVEDLKGKGIPIFDRYEELEVLKENGVEDVVITVPSPRDSMSGRQACVSR